MSEPVINLINEENPEDLDHQQVKKEENKNIQIDDYILHQSFFTKHQLINQANFQVIHFDGNFDHSQSLSQGVYMGGTHMNMYHGWGILVLKNTVFQGKFSLGHKMGKGYMKFPNKSVYIGDFTNDKPHGQGMMQYGDEYYIGDFENGAMQGDGLWKNKKGQKFVGCWRNNKAHGYGIYSTQQSHFQGEFANFVKHGYGIQNFPNGDVFRGNYIHGKPHGKGQYYWGNGASYKGQFLKGFRQGQGIWISEAGDKYVGHFSGDRKNGHGQYSWANGNSYKGQFCEDMREGEGQMIWNDGSTYNGEWQRGLPHGKGIFKVKGEKPRAGYFEDNVMITESKQKQYSGNEPISAHHRDSLILAMIPQVSRKHRKRKLMSEKKSTKNPFPVSTSSTMSFMKTKSKNRTWRSRQK